MFLIESCLSIKGKETGHKNNSLNRVHANTIMHIMLGISPVFVVFKAAGKCVGLVSLDLQNPSNRPDHVFVISPLNKSWKCFVE